MIIFQKNLIKRFANRLFVVGLNWHTSNHRKNIVLKFNAYLKEWYISRDTNCYQTILEDTFYK